MAQMVPPFAVQRLAHHRSRDTNCPTCSFGGYYRQARVSASWDASKAAWASDFGYGGSAVEYADIYAIDLSPLAAATVSIVSPANGATVSGTVNVTANASVSTPASAKAAGASASAGVARVQFLLDGVVVSTITASPYQYAWDTTGVANGAHSLTVKAFDAAGRSVRQAVAVTVSDTDNAEYVSSVVPSTMTIGQSYLVSLTLKNTGNYTWTSGYGLALQSTGYWNVGRVPLNAAETVPPGYEKTFTFAVQPPSAAGAYSMQWGLARGSAGFGNSTPKISVTANSQIVASAPGVAQTLTNLSPNAAGGIVLHGAGFAPGAMVLFSGSASGVAAAQVLNPQTLSFTLPPGFNSVSALGNSASYVIAVQNPDGAQSPAVTLNLASPASSGASLTFGQVYVYPNPSTRSKKPTFHIELAGSLDNVRLDIYDAAGAIVDRQNLPVSSFVTCPDGVPCFEFTWDDSREASGVYLYVVKASGAGVSGVTKTGKLAIVK